MAYVIQPDSHGRWHLMLTGQSANCRALETAPANREDYLNQGNWLVVLIPIWGGADRGAIDIAMSISAKPDVSLQVGIRLFDEFEEIKSWLPEALGEFTTPQWFVLQNGRLAAQRFGLLDEEHARQLVREALSGQK